MPPQRILIVDSDPNAALVTQGGLQRFLGPEVAVTIAPLLIATAESIAARFVSTLMRARHAAAPAGGR